MYVFLEVLKEIKKAIFMLGGFLLGFNGGTMLFNDTYPQSTLILFIVGCVLFGIGFVGTLLEGIIGSSKWYKKLDHDYWLRQLEKEEAECLK